MNYFLIIITITRSNYDLYNILINHEIHFVYSYVIYVRITTVYYQRKEG